jgi:large subunit ribosomal protein L15
MTYKRKKFTRQRGKKTHGWGAKKKHRGSGNRGGKGFAGTGKRADTIKPSMWKLKNWEGKHGFKIQRKIEELAINVKELDHRIDSYVKENKAKMANGIYEINLDELNIKKLIGSGETKKAFKISVAKASEIAVKKITAAKGSVHLLKKLESKEEKKPE